MKWKRWVSELRFSLVNESPLHIGTQDDELLIDEETGRAIIPGSSLTGAFRWYAETVSTDIAGRMFGGKRLDWDKRPSALIVHDMESESSFLPFEVRPGVRIHGHYGAVDGRGKFERIFLPVGLTFTGKIIWTADDETEHEAFAELMAKCMHALDQGVIRLGKYKNSGGGEMRLSGAYCKTYDLHDPDQLFAFLEAGLDPRDISRSGGESWVARIRSGNEEKAYRFELKVTLSRLLLIRGPRKQGPNEPDASPFRRTDGVYVIPGTGWRGALRHHVRRILAYLDKLELEELAFGTMAHATNNDPGEEPGFLRQGAVQTADAEIVEDRSLKRQEVDYYGIRINKFTGGVMTSYMKRERTIRGKALLRLHVRPKPNDSSDTAEAIAGLLLLALRDMAEQGFALGSGSGSGRGFVVGERLDIHAPEGSATIRFADGEIDNQTLLRRWLDALHQWQP